MQPDGVVSSGGWGSPEAVTAPGFAVRTIEDGVGRGKSATRVSRRGRRTERGSRVTPTEAGSTSGRGRSPRPTPAAPSVPPCLLTSQLNLAQPTPGVGSSVEAELDRYLDHIAVLYGDGRTQISGGEGVPKSQRAVGRSRGGAAVVLH